MDLVIDIYLVFTIIFGLLAATGYLITGFNSFSMRKGLAWRKDRAKYTKRGVKSMLITLLLLIAMITSAVTKSAVLEPASLNFVAWLVSNAFMAVATINFIKPRFGAGSVKDFVGDLFYQDFQSDLEDVVVSKIDVHGMDQYVATEPGTSVVGVGSTKKEAVEDYQNQEWSSSERERYNEKHRHVGRGWVHNETDGYHLPFNKKYGSRTS